MAGAEGRAPAGQAIPGLLRRAFAGRATLAPATGLPVAADDAAAQRLTAVHLASDCAYYYYGCMGQRDHEWGCCYRYPAAPEATEKDEKKREEKKRKEKKKKRR